MATSIQLGWDRPAFPSRKLTVMCAAAPWMDVPGTSIHGKQVDLPPEMNKDELVWCLKSKHQIMVLAARATDAKMVSALLCHTNGLGSSL